MNSANNPKPASPKVRLTCGDCGKKTVRTVAKALDAACKCGASMIDATVETA